MLCSRLSTGALFAALISTGSHLFSVGVVEATTPSEPFLYYVFYEDDAFGTQCRANPAAIKGYVSGNEFPVTGGSGDTCAAEMACQIDANSNQCENLDRTVSGSGVTVVTADGQIQECDSTNFVVGQTECFFFEYLSLTWMFTCILAASGSPKPSILHGSEVLEHQQQQ